MKDVYWAYAVLGATVLVLSTAAGPIKRRLWVSEPMLATLAGVALGPAGVALFRPEAWGHSTAILEQLARLTLAISLMGVALRLPNTWVRRRVKPLALILGVGMPLTWLVSSVCAWSVLGLPVNSAFLLGAILAPTDPVVASAIVTGKLAERSVEPDVRHLISAESGANDGLAFVFVMLPVLLFERGTEDALVHWVSVILLAQVVGSALLGAFFGYACGKLLERIYGSADSERGSLLAVSVALSLFILGTSALLHVDGILAVFAAGLAFNWVVREEEGHDEAHHERVQEAITRFFDVPVFFFFGMVVPWRDWFLLGWPALVFTLLLLLLRRVPVILLLYPRLSEVPRLKDALFLGWFGPMAVAAIVYATWGKVQQGRELLWQVASLAIFASILVHGITATPFTRWYARSRN